jgi:hypothetical protein
MIHIYVKKKMYAIIIAGYVCINKPINQISTLKINDWCEFEVHNLVANFVLTVGVQRFLCIKIGTQVTTFD